MTDPASHQRTVVVADDDLVIRTILREFLQSRGFFVVEVTDGDAVLTAVVQHEPAMVFLDGRMPRMDGLDVTRALRRDPNNDELVIMLISARALKSDIERAYAVGITDYVTKPFDLTDLGRRLDALEGRSTVVQGKPTP